MNAAHRGKGGATAAPMNIELVAAENPVAGGSPPLPTAGPDQSNGEGAFAESVEHQGQVLSQMITAEVRNALNHARGQMGATRKRQSRSSRGNWRT